MAHKLDMSKTQHFLDMRDPDMGQGSCGVSHVDLVK